MTAKTAVQRLRDAGIKPKPGEGLDAYLNRGGRTIIRKIYLEMPPESRLWALDQLRKQGVDISYLEEK
jgi:hypothetical protein